MKHIDTDKIDQAVLALLYLTSEKDRFGNVHAWKGHDWDALNRLHVRGFIDDATNKNKSVNFTPEGFELAKEAFERLFMVEE